MQRFTEDFLRELQEGMRRQLEALSAFLDGADAARSSPPPADPPALSSPGGLVFKDLGSGWGIYSKSYIGAIVKQGGDEVALQYTDGTFREWKEGILQYRFYSGGKQHSIYGCSKSDCWQKRNKLEHSKPSQSNSKKTMSEVMTYREWADEWMRLYKEPAGHKTGYLKTIRGYLHNYIIPNLGDLPLREIKTLTLQRFLVNIQSDCTRTKCAAILSESLRDAAAAELIPRNPYEGVRFKRYEQPELGALTHRQQIALLEAVDRSRLADWKMPVFARAMLMTGLRQGELNALRACDVDFDNMEISVGGTWDRYDNERVKPKTKAGKRTVPIAEPLAELLRPVVESVADPEERIFGYEGSYTPRYFGKIFRSMGLNYSGHILRHTFITNCYELGFPPYMVKRWVGHARVEQADVYLALRKPSEFVETEIIAYMRLLKRLTVLEPR